MADDKIAQEYAPVILSLPRTFRSAAAALAKGGRVLDPRGEIYTRDNIEARLAMRKFMDELRASGVDTRRASTLQPGRPAGVCPAARTAARAAGAAEFAPKPPSAGA